MTDDDVTITRLVSSRLDAEVLSGVFLRFSDALATGDEDHRIIERMVTRVNEDGAFGDVRATETRAFVTRLVSRMHVTCDPELAGVYAPEELAT